MVAVHLVAFIVMPVLFFYTSQFCFASLAIRERFRLLNETLKVTRSNQEIKCLDVVRQESSLKRFSKLYCCDGIELINSMFTSYLIFIIFFSIGKNSLSKTNYKTVS